MSASATQGGHNKVVQVGPSLQKWIRRIRAGNHRSDGNAISLRCDHCSNDSHCLTNILQGATENPSHWPLCIKTAPGNTLWTVLTRIRCCEFFCNDFVTDLSKIVKVKEFWNRSTLQWQFLDSQPPATQSGWPQSRRKEFPKFSRAIIILF